LTGGSCIAGRHPSTVFVKGAPSVRHSERSEESLRVLREVLGCGCPTFGVKRGVLDSRSASQEPHPCTHHKDGAPNTTRPCGRVQPRATRPILTRPSFRAQRGIPQTLVASTYPRQPGDRAPARASRSEESGAVALRLCGGLKNNFGKGRPPACATRVCQEGPRRVARPWRCSYFLSTALAVEGAPSLRIFARVGFLTCVVWGCGWPAVHTCNASDAFGCRIPCAFQGCGF
jgi:hypothetical protein